MAQAVDVPKVYRGLILDQPVPAGLLGGLEFMKAIMTAEKERAKKPGGSAGRAELRQFRMAVKTSAD